MTTSKVKRTVRTNKITYDSYLKAKEVMYFTLLLGTVKESNKYHSEERDTLQDVMSGLTEMYYNDYVEGKQLYEPHITTFTEGDRYGD
jgi:hypothetical protein